MKKTKTTRVVTLCLAIIIMLAPIGKADITTAKTSNVTNISIRNKASVYVGKTITLKANVKNSKNTKKLIWKSSNKKIATVSSKGRVVGKKAGTVKITVRLGKKKAVCNVTVKNNKQVNAIPAPAPTATITSTPTPNNAVEGITKEPEPTPTAIQPNMPRYYQSTSVDDLLNWIKKSDTTGEHKQFLENVRKQNSLLVANAVSNTITLNKILVYPSQYVEYLFKGPDGNISILISLKGGFTFWGSTDEHLSLSQKIENYNKKQKEIFENLAFVQGTKNLKYNTDVFYLNGGNYKKLDDSNQDIKTQAYFEIDGVEISISLLNEWGMKQPWDNAFIDLFEFNDVKL